MTDAGRLDRGRSHRLADAAALAGICFALLGLLALGAVLSFDSMIVSLQGPDPCGAVQGKFPPDTACVLAHPGFYAYDPATGLVTQRSLLISQAVDPVVGPATPLLALAAAMSSWLALATGTLRRRTAITALTISALIGVAVIVLVLGFALGGGGE